jgi:hypothetical protein
MTIATFQSDMPGARIYAPEGPFGTSGNFPIPNFKPGTVVAGDNGSEFIYLTLPVAAPYTANQGDVYSWDNTMVCTRAGEIAAAAEYELGTPVGTLFLGGRVGDAAAHPAGGNIWSYTFPATGMYGVWLQRSGVSLANVNATTTLTIPSTSVAAAGRMTFLAVGTNKNAISPGTFAFIATSKTFTATTLAGSAVLTGANTGKFVQKGMILTGTGIPGTTTANATVVIDVQGATVTMSQAATASASITVTALAQSTSGTTTNGSAVLTNVQSIVGFYPNQTIAGTGIPGSTTIVSITGVSAPYSITMSANATATANFISFTTTGMPNYAEVMLSRPFYSATTT